MNQLSAPSGSSDDVPVIDLEVVTDDTWFYRHRPRPLFKARAVNPPFPYDHRNVDRATADSEDSLTAMLHVMRVINGRDTQKRGGQAAFTMDHILDMKIKLKSQYE